MASNRFTRGRLGRLSFDVLNEIFARLDRLEGVPGRPRRVKYDPRLIFRAKIIDVRANQGSDSGGFAQEASFDEVVIDGLDPGAVLTGGRTSYDNRTTQSDPFHEPIIGNGLTAGSTVFVHPTNTVRGKLRYLVISGAAAAGRVSAPYVIESATEITTNQSQKMWRYSLNPLVINATTTNRIDSIAGAATAFIFAFNLTEFNTDANNQYGLGFRPDIVPGPGPTLVRQPIKIGTVVEVFSWPNSNTSGPTPISYFLAPNGYEVTCP